uniref:Uncharacterized protein n=1 Tax=Plectus sambesii TaxID=2011161 RepID=A0A914XIP3_9BILA
MKFLLFIAAMGMVVAVCNASCASGDPCSGTCCVVCSGDGCWAGCCPFQNANCCGSGPNLRCSRAGTQCSKTINVARSTPLAFKRQNFIDRLRRSRQPTLIHESPFRRASNVHLLLVH